MTNSVPRDGRSDETPVIRIDAPATSPFPGPGTMVDVAVNLNSDGVTAAAGFSVEWAPLDLKFMNVALGAGSSGGTLITNLSELAMGRLGVMVSKGIGGTWDAGESAMLVLQFLVLNPEPISFNPIRMIESPIPKSVSDKDANRQNAVFLDGFLLTGGGAIEDDSYWPWIATFGLEDPQFLKDADPDGDGQGNYVEMLQGTDPTNPQSRLAITSVRTLEDHSREVTWLSTPGKTYALEFATNLTAPQWLSVGVVPASPMPGTTTAYIDDQNLTPPMGFYRVRLLEAYYDYQRWISSFGLTGADSLPSANPDGDLRDNWSEFLEDTDPTDPLDPPVVAPVITGISGAVDQGWSIAWTSVPGHTYAVEGRSGLDAQQSWRLLQQLRATGAETSWVDPETGLAHRFYHIVDLGP